MRETTAELVRSARCGLADVSRSLRIRSGGPANYRLASHAWAPPRLLGDAELVPQTTGGNPSGTMVHFAQLAPGSRGTMAEIVVWETSPLRLVHTVASEQFARRVPYDHPPPGPRKNLEAVRLVDMEHLAAGLCDGRLQVYALRAGLLAEALVGGSIGDLACSSTHLAVSLFPGPPQNRLYESCGIKLFALQDLVAGRIAPTDFIPSEELGFIPHTLQYDASGTQLICLGGSTHRKRKRVTNKAAVWDTVARRTRWLLHDEDTAVGHTISNLARDGGCALVGRSTATWYDCELRTRARRRRPAAVMGGEAPCRLAVGPGPLFLGKRGGIYVYRPDRGRAVYLAELGRAKLLHVRQDGALVLWIHQADTYCLVALDPESLEIVEASETPSAVETIPQNGYDCTGDGTLAVADRTGAVRIFNWEVHAARRVPSDGGPVSHILADRSRDRFALLTNSGAVHVLNPGDAAPKPYVPSYSGRPIHAPSSWRGIRLAPYRDPRYFLFLCYQVCDRFVSVDGVRGVGPTSRSGGCELEIEERDWARKQWNTIGRFTVPASVCGGDAQRNRAVFILHDGTLLFVDPYRFCLGRRGRTMILESDGVHCARVETDGIISPRGLRALGAGKLAVWSDEDFWLTELEGDHAVSRCRHRAVAGIRNIKWDRARDRLVLLMPTHLSIWSLDLQVLFNLYILRDGCFMVHVPYPRELCAADAAHPGYFWSDHPDPTSFWEVTDARGNIIKDPRQRREYLDHYCSQFMVERATGDYQRFIHDLHARRMSPPSSSPRQLTTSWRDPDPDASTRG